MVVKTNGGELEINIWHPQSMSEALYLLQQFLFSLVYANIFYQTKLFFFRLIHSLREVCQNKVFNNSHAAFIWENTTARKVSKYEVISGTYFPVFGLNTERYFVSLRFSPNAGKYRPEITPYLDIFHAVHESEKIHVLAYFTQ